MEMYILIMAGGTGTRLWPRSRRDNPKQLLNLVNAEKTMLRETYDRIAPLVSPQNVLVMTNMEYTDEVREQLPDLIPENVVGEPAGRGSAPAIGMAAMFIKQANPEAIMVCLPADHVITQQEHFRQVLKAAAKVARDGHLVTLGIKPQYAETGFGYIEGGELLQEVDGIEARRVARFTEKPDDETAAEFVSSGRYFWNSGMFIWRVDAILREFERWLPDHYRALQAIGERRRANKKSKISEDLWNPMKNETIDFGIMEKAEDVVVLPVDIGWSDVGNWASLHELLPADAENNVVIGKHVGIDTGDSLIYSPQRVIATIGLQNLIIVDTDDALLICPRDRAQDVKKIVSELEEMNKQELL